MKKDFSYISPETPFVIEKEEMNKIDEQMQAINDAIKLEREQMKRDGIQVDLTEPELNALEDSENRMDVINEMVGLESKQINQIEGLNDPANLNKALVMDFDNRFEETGILSKIFGNDSNYSLSENPMNIRSLEYGSTKDILTGMSLSAEMSDNIQKDLLNCMMEGLNSVSESEAYKEDTKLSQANVCIDRVGLKY